MVGEGAALLVRRALAAAGLGDVRAALARFLEIYDTPPAESHAPVRRHRRRRPRGAHARPRGGPDQQARAAERTHPPGPRPARPVRRSDRRRRPVAAQARPGSAPGLMERAGTTAAQTLLVGDSAIDHETAVRARSALLPGDLRLRVRDVSRRRLTGTSGCRRRRVDCGGRSSSLRSAGDAERSYAPSAGPA